MCLIKLLSVWYISNYRPTSPKNMHQIITWANTSQWVNVVFFLSFRKAGREISKVFHLTVEMIKFKECSLFLCFYCTITTKYYINIELFSCANVSYCVFCLIELYFSQNFLLPKMMLKDFNNFVNHLKMKYNALVIPISFGSFQE